MAVPIFERGTNRRCYFPSGKWFGFDGVLASNTATGESRQISGILPETPMFIRGGYMIPTLVNILSYANYFLNINSLIFATLLFSKVRKVKLLKTHCKAITL